MTGAMEALAESRARHRRIRHGCVPHRRYDPDRLIDPGMRLIGLWIRDARLRAGMGQAQLGRLAHVHQSTISRLENGRLEGLSLYKLAMIVAVLDDALKQLPLRWA